MDNKDNVSETIKSNFPLLWYLLDTISSVYKKALKNKSVNNDKIYWYINTIFILCSPIIKFTNSNFWIITDIKIAKIFLLSFIIAWVNGNSLKL